jgi:polysaccharide export outer membrane protein
MKINPVISDHLATGWQQFAICLFATAMLLLSGGCQSAPQPHFEQVAGVPTEAPHSESIILREGDILKISFPGASSLDTTQQIRRDGKIALPLGGEMDAAGKTPAQLEKDLAEHYASQLVSKEVTVSVQSSSFPIFVTGAVLKPGKILADHPMTALEAIMEAGGFDYSKANLKSVKIVREKPPGSFTLSFKGLLNGRQPEAFYMKPFDIIYVPQKFSWF